MVGLARTSPTYPSQETSLSSPALYRRIGLAALGASLAVPAGAAAQTGTIAPVGAECFVHADRDDRDDSDYAKYTPAQVPTLSVSGLNKEKSGQSQYVTVTNAGPGTGLFQGTSVPTLTNGAFTEKYLLFPPRSVFTGGDPLPTRKAELNTLVITHELNDVVKWQGSITFRLGVLAATTRFRDKATQRRKSTWKVSGLGPGAYYAFFRAKGKTAWKVKLGKATGPCGFVSTKQFTKPKKGKGPWSIQIQRGASFAKSGRRLVYNRRSAGLFGAGEFNGIYEKP